MLYTVFDQGINMIITTVKNILISILLAFWLGAIAIFSVQNAAIFDLVWYKKLRLEAGDRCEMYFNSAVLL